MLKNSKYNIVFLTQLIMKTLNVLIIAMIIFGLSCTRETRFSDENKKLVEAEILEFMDSLVVAMNSVSADNVFKYFLQTEEFVVATRGELIVNPSSFLDTMKVHLAIMEKQDNKTVKDKIFVISKEAAVISTSEVTTITFKSGGEVTMPYALTMLLVKRDGKWKIVHYHN